jgi:hypothetical protein
MKTTIELSDAIFSHAKAISKQNKTTLRAMIEEGLRRMIHEHQTIKKPAFKLKNLSVRGKKSPLMEAPEWLQLEANDTMARLKK